jgi:hypothetical protein
MANEAFTPIPSSPQALPRKRKILREELLIERRRIAQEIALMKIDLECVDSEIREAILFGYFPRSGGLQVPVAADGTVRVIDPPKPAKGEVLCEASVLK